MPENWPQCGLFRGDLPKGQWKHNCKRKTHPVQTQSSQNKRRICSAIISWIIFVDFRLNKCNIKTSSFNCFQMVLINLGVDNNWYGLFLLKNTKGLIEIFGIPKNGSLALSLRFYLLAGQTTSLGQNQEAHDFSRISWLSVREAASYCPHSLSNTSQKLL